MTNVSHEALPRVGAWVGRVVALSGRHARLVILLGLAQHGAASVYGGRNIAIDTDTTKLISSDVPWRQREIAFDRAEKDNRDRWMAMRALGLMGEKTDVPQLIPLVYHGNVNTRWWAQISLVRLTKQNFGKDWNAWGKWWNAQNIQPAYNPEIIRWWSGQGEADQLAASLDESDRKFLSNLKAK